MATLYPGGVDGTAQLPNPSGTNTMDSPDHALLHTTENGAITALENTVGTTSGTNVLKNFTAGQFPVPMNSGGTIVQVLNLGTLNNFILGTPTITGGTINNANVGTLNNSTLGTPAITGGTANSLTYPHWRC